MKTYAINICLVPSQPFYKRVCELSKFDTSNYSLNSKPFIPHATLIMKNMKAPDLDLLINKVENIEKKQIITHSIGYYSEPWGGVNWVGVSLEKTSAIGELQKEIFGITSSFTDIIPDRGSYIVDEFCSEEINGEISSPLTKTQLENKGIHITFGLTDLEKEYNKLEGFDEIIFDKIVIGHMGNYGSVREVLYQKELI